LGLELGIESISTLSAIRHSRYAFMMRATGAAEKFTAGFNAVTNDFATAMFATGREQMDRAFEAIEIMRDAVHKNFQRLVVFVSADFTFHELPFR
jgi:hypothetical protein